jgi:hypothetical protein
MLILVDIENKHAIAVTGLKFCHMAWCKVYTNVDPFAVKAFVLSACKSKQDLCNKICGYKTYLHVGFLC